MSVKDLYEEFPFPFSGNHDGFIAKYVAPYISGNPKAILDAGCGTGNLSLDLAQRYPESSIVGVDFSVNSLARAKELISKADLDHVNFCHVDLMEGFSDEHKERYDFVMSVGCVHHTPDPALALRHLRSVVSDGGRMVVAVYGKYGRIDTEMLRQLVGLLRESTHSSNQELLDVCRELTGEQELNLNRFFKRNRWHMLKRDPGLFIHKLVNKTKRMLGARGPDQVPMEIGMADQILHPLVHNWGAGQWVDVIEASDFHVEGMVYDPSSTGICIPERPIDRLSSDRLRSILEQMTSRDQMEALDLLYRPAMNIFVCTPGQGSSQPGEPASSVSS